MEYTREMIDFYEDAFRKMTNLDFKELNPCSKCDCSCDPTTIECPQLVIMASDLCIKYTKYLKILEPDIPVLYVVMVRVTAGGITDILLQPVGDFKLEVESIRKSIKTDFNSIIAKEMCMKLDHQVHSVLSVEPRYHSMFKFIELLSRYKGDTHGT